MLITLKNTTFLCKKIIISKSKEVKPGCNMAESAKECYGSERAVLSVMMMLLQ
jgi:hypothetical protein